MPARNVSILPRRKPVIAVVGAGKCSKKLRDLAVEIGGQIARAGAVLVCGGLGGVMEYISTSAKSEHGYSKFSIDQIQGSEYATWVPSSLNNLAVDAIVGYGYDWFDVNRLAGSIQTSVKAKGNPHGMVADALLGAEYMILNDTFQAMPKNLVLTPLVNLQYIWARIDEYDEHNAGDYNLRVHSQRVESLRTTLGTRFEYMVHCKNFTFKPEIDLAWQFEYLDHDRQLDFSTINLAETKNVSNTIVGAGRNTLLFGVDFLFTIYKSFEIEASYDLQWNNLYTNNTFYLGIGGRF